MKTKQAFWVFVLALVVAVAAGAVSWYASRAKITGSTLEERVASVCRLAADRPHGWTGALAEAAMDANEPPELRRAALAGLTGVKDGKVRQAFEQGLSNEDAQLRAIAAGGVGAFGDKPAADALVALMDGDKDAGVRHAAMAGLARCDDPRGIVSLLQRAEDRGKPAPDRLAAMTALAGRLLATLGADHRPENTAKWANLVQRLKRMHIVQKAFADAGVALVQRPQDIIGPDAHPERGDRELDEPDGEHEHDD